MRLYRMLLLAVICAVNQMTANAQRLVGTIYGVTNAGLLNVYEHSGGNAQTRYIHMTKPVHDVFKCRTHCMHTFAF